MYNSDLSIPLPTLNYFLQEYQSTPYYLNPYQNWQFNFFYNYPQSPFIESSNLIPRIQFKNDSNPITNLVQSNGMEEITSSQERQQTTQNRKRKNAKRSNKYQKEDRNLNSIVLRNFSNFIHGHPQIVPIIQNIITKNHLPIQVTSYLDIFKQNIPAKLSYVGVGKMKSFLDLDKEKAGIRLITLILLKKFIHYNFFTVLVHSKKVSSSARQKELRHGKKFLKFFVRQVL